LSVLSVDLLPAWLCILQKRTKVW